MAATFQAAGIPAEALDGMTPVPTRRAILQRLHSGATRVVANCAVLTEGFDEPSVDCIIVARPTQSALLYQQMLGQGDPHRIRARPTVCSSMSWASAPNTPGVPPAATLLGVTQAAPGPAVRAGEPRHAGAPAPGRAPGDWDLTQYPGGPVRAPDAALGADAAGRLGVVPGGAPWDAAAPHQWAGHLGGSVQVRRDAEPLRLGDTLPLPYAQGLAEDYARHLGVARLVEAEAPWRRRPATEKQTALLRKLGLAARAGLTKGEAAESAGPRCSGIGIEVRSGGVGVSCRAAHVPSRRGL